MAAWVCRQSQLTDVCYRCPSVSDRSVCNSVAKLPLATMLMSVACGGRVVVDATGTGGGGAAISSSLASSSAATGAASVTSGGGGDAALAMACQAACAATAP